MVFHFIPTGALPGTAEQDAGDQVEPPPGPDHRALQHQLHVWGLHWQPAQTARRHGQWASPAAGRAEKHAGSGWGLQSEVSASIIYGHLPVFTTCHRRNVWCFSSYFYKIDHTVLHLCRYEVEINKRATVENEFVLLKQVKTEKSVYTLSQCSAMISHC